MPYRFNFIISYYLAQVELMVKIPKKQWCAESEGMVLFVLSACDTAFIEYWVFVVWRIR
jgi:hypothetical protein